MAGRTYESREKVTILPFFLLTNPSARVRLVR